MKITCTIEEKVTLLAQLVQYDCDFCVLKQKCSDDDKYKDCYETFNGEIEWTIIKEREVIANKYKIITLCGSTKFKDEFIKAQRELILQGCIVMPFVIFEHSGDNELVDANTKEMLIDMHKRMIDLSDEIFVINVGGYIGETTKLEIEYAINTGKKDRYLVN